MACRTAAQAGADAVLCLAFPEHPPGKPEKLRTDHLPALELPCLFVSGDRDPFGSPAELEAATSTIPGPVTHHWITGGRHDLAKADALGNLADPERLANPDNLKFSETLRTLFIGEDSSLHVNNFLWAYNVDSGTLTRVLSVPAGAESTL